MGLTRREFLKEGLAAFGFLALDGLPIFAASVGFKPKKKPNLVFGILTDTHLQSGWDGVTPHRAFPLTYVTNAMRLFGERGIDAFVHLGDAAHRGKNVEVQYHRDIFEKFFPNGKGRDGRTVEKLVVAGNHELYGNEVGGNGAWAPNIWKDPVERAKHILCADLPRFWQKTWGEKYEKVWHREVGGYHFFGRHWETKEEALADFINEHAEEYGLRGTKPFFILSHRRHHSQFFKSLKDFPNAIAFFGHWHQSNADWKTIYYDSFGGFFPSIEVGACRNDGGNALDANESVLKAKLDEGNADRDDGRKEQNWHSNKVQSRQAMIVNVYDDFVVFERHEVGEGGKLGPDWMLPLAWREKKDADGKPFKHPFSREMLTRRIGAPEFQEKAKMEIGGIGDSLKLTIPLADGNPKSRVFAYDVVAIGDDPAQKLFKSAYFEGVNLGIGHEPDGGVTTVEISKADLPAGKNLTLAVRPISSLGTKGKPLVATYSTTTGRLAPRKA